jgi:hypothetical protein
MIKKTMWMGLALALLGFVPASSARAAQTDDKTVLTFSQPVEIPGQVLPAGTYTFKLVDSMSDRHIVRIFGADGSEVIATVMAIPDRRLTSTDETVIKFSEVPAGSPEALRAWFYPGSTVGQAFVYPKARALQLAKASKAAVPAIADDAADVDSMKAAPIIAITPDEQEEPVTAAIQTTPVKNAATAPYASSSGAGTAGVTQDATRLPQTASALPLIVLLGFASIGAAIGLMVFGKHAAGAAV